MPLGQTAKLPRAINGQYICNRKPGFSGYTVPWALVIDEHANCWLRSNFKAYRFGGYGTGTLRLRVELREDGWHVWLPRGVMQMPAEYNLRDKRHLAFREAAERRPLAAVAEIHLYDPAEGN